MTTAVHNVRDAIVIGGLFSILILLAFLRSWRAMLISALAIPTTLAITFLFLYWTGETLNLMSLGGLAVAIGLIIDDTVVVVENIARHLSPARSVSKPSPGILEPASAAVPEANGTALVKPSSRQIRRWRSHRQSLRRDHGGSRRIDFDNRSRLFAAGIHCRRLRPVLRRA